MLHIYASVNTGFGSDNGLSPTRRQAFIWTNAGLLPMGPQGTNFTEILIKNEQTFHSRKGIWTDRLWNGGHLVQRADELPACGAASECHAWLDSTSSGGISSTCLWGLGDLYVKPSDNPAVFYSLSRRVTRKYTYTSWSKYYVNWCKVVVSIENSN